MTNSIQRGAQIKDLSVVIGWCSHYIQDKELTRLPDSVGFL